MPLSQSGETASASPNRYGAASGTSIIPPAVSPSKPYPRIPAKPRVVGASAGSWRKRFTTRSTAVPPGRRPRRRGRAVTGTRRPVQQLGVTGIPVRQRRQSSLNTSSKGPTGRTGRPLARVMTGRFRPLRPGCTPRHAPPRMVLRRRCAVRCRGKRRRSMALFRQVVIVTFGPSDSPTATPPSS